MNLLPRTKEELIGRKVRFADTFLVREAIRKERIIDLTPNRQYTIVGAGSARQNETVFIINIVDDGNEKISAILKGDTAHLASLVRWELVPLDQELEAVQPIATQKDIIDLFDSVEDFNKWYLETRDNIKQISKHLSTKRPIKHWRTIND